MANPAQCLELENAKPLHETENFSGTEIMLAYDHPGLRSPFNGKGRAERQELTASYRGPVPDLRGALPEYDDSEALCGRAARLLRVAKHRRKAA